jgi:hypothetical protein
MNAHEYFPIIDLNVCKKSKAKELVWSGGKNIPNCSLEVLEQNQT